MTPKERAEQLIDKMIQAIGSDCEHECYCMKPQCEYKGMIRCVVNQDQARQCAIILVDEILNGAMVWQFIDETRVFWNQVKEELTKIPT